MPSLTRDIPNDSDLARRIRSEVMWRIKKSEQEMQKKYDKWRDAEDRALAYLPERDVDAKRRRAREGGLPQYTTIQIPYSYAVLMAAHTYVTSVFLNRSPVLQIGARHGETEMQVQGMEALLDYQMLVGKMLVPIYIWIYDHLKYGIGILGCYWEDRVESIANIEPEMAMDPTTGQPTPTGRKIETRGIGRTYSGNKVYNIQPWDFLWDVRYPSWRFQEGEYLGLRFNLNWNEMKRREYAGYYMNLDQITGDATGDGQHGSNSGSAALDRPETTDPQARGWWSGDRPPGEPRHPSLVKGYELYCEIIPKEWGISNSPYPEKWVFSVTQDFKVLFGAQPLGAWHCKFPVNVLSLEPEGYGLTTRGLPEILEPVQNTIDWLINTHFYNIRAALNNTFVVDPSRIVMKDVLNPLPGGIVRLKPSAYGSDPKLAITQFNVQDVTQVHLRDLPTMFGIGERVVGINDQIMGLLNTGGRKTATEVRTSTSFGVNRLKTISEFASASGFDPFTQMLIQNTQQYYDMEQKFKIAGDLVATSGQGFLMVNPQLVQGFYDFVPVDGTLPIDRYAQSNMWMQMMGQMARMPSLMMQYDMGKMFAWVAKLAGMKNVDQFRIQLAPDQVLMAQAQQGNVIPMGGKSTDKAFGPKSPNSTSPSAPAQIPNMGVAA